MTVTMFEAKTKLSELVDKVEQGQEVVITRGRERKPVAKVVPISTRKITRLGAMLDPNYVMSPDFLEVMSAEELAEWEGKPL